MKKKITQVYFQRVFSVTKITTIISINNQQLKGATKKKQKTFLMKMSPPLEILSKKKNFFTFPSKKDSKLTNKNLKTLVLILFQGIGCLKVPLNNFYFYFKKNSFFFFFFFFFFFT